jgi:hypothetical protein
MRVMRGWIIFVAVLLGGVAGAQSTAPQQHQSVAIVVDDSLAAGKHQATLARSVQRFVKFFSADDEICIFAAKEKPMLWQDFTSDPDLLSERVAKLYGRGKLALYDTIQAAARHLQSEAGNDERILAVFTAGEDNASAIKFPALLADPALKLPVFAVAGPEADWRIQEPMQVLARQSPAGRAYFVSDDSEMLDVARQMGWRITGRNDEVIAANAAKPLLPYKVVVVPSIPIANSRSTEQVSGDNVLLHRVLVSRLRKSGLFTEVIDADTGASGANGRLELLATVTGFQQGSRAKREFLPFGGGTKLTVQVVVREAGNTQPLLGFVAEGNASSGLFGGSDEKVESEAIIRAADQIIAELRKRK